MQEIIDNLATKVGSQKLAPYRPPPPDMGVLNLSRPDMPTPKGHGKT